ncbi:hypothetical protein MPNT_50099 [Candidatus Methylacidithermus pantelleriae]|uniref:Uncharacterized protein n=1 Tax=Candidatus Methylacidithermus pantelleriae TaxID=2744239 RepID=A0A8J2FX21_9BACT|nr:hypothetical protein MPNT_50099 [Candidatus Methylacidithermus pantelleriae]
MVGSSYPKKVLKKTPFLLGAFMFPPAEEWWLLRGGKPQNIGLAIPLRRVLFRQEEVFLLFLSFWRAPWEG